MDLAFLLLALVGGQDAAGSATGAGEARPSRLERRICRQMQLTGTRLRRVRVCQTQAEWDGATANWQSDLRNFQDRQSVVSYGPGGRTTCPSSVPC